METIKPLKKKLLLEPVLRKSAQGIKQVKPLKSAGGPLASGKKKAPTKSPQKVSKKKIPGLMSPLDSPMMSPGVTKTKKKVLSKSPRPKTAKTGGMDKSEKS